MLAMVYKMLSKRQHPILTLVSIVQTYKLAKNLAEVVVLGDDLILRSPTLALA